jgi:mRNA-degrading endonuclease toxin of MazEF toxin-antitoxin module
MAARRLGAPDRRDMIWIDCNPQAGREMKDMHPLLVLSPKAFNERTGIVIGLPMTTSAFVMATGAPCAAPHSTAHCGRQEPSPIQERAGFAPFRAGDT